MVRTLVIASLALSAQVIADDGDAGPRKFPQVRSMMATLTGLSEKEVSAHFRNYGCYCYIDGKRTVGGTFAKAMAPLDELDQACKHLYRAQKCVAIDMEEGVHTHKARCDVTSSYRWYVQDGQIECGDQNDPTYYTEQTCRMHVCELEKAFALKIKALYDGGWAKTTEFYRMDDATYQEKCIDPHAGNGGNNGNDAEWSCCGTGVNRKTYNSLVNTCCDDGSVKAIGLCVN